MTAPTSRTWRAQSGARRVFVRDPSDVTDYSFDWTDLLSGAETISTSTWTTTLTTAGAAIASPITTVTVSGGTNGSDYTLTNTVGTSGGRTLERSVTMQVRDL